MNDIPEKELDIHFSIGFLQEWLKDAPIQVKQYLDHIISGVDYYRQKLKDSEEDLEILTTRYNQLTALSAGYIQLIQEQRQQIETFQIEEQRPFHQKEE